MDGVIATRQELVALITDIRADVKSNRSRNGDVVKTIPERSGPGDNQLGVGLGQLLYFQHDGCYTR